MSILGFVFATSLFAQEVNIVNYLKEIERGNARKVEKELPQLKDKYPNDPSVLFLDAVLTTNGEEALRKYFKVYGEFPKSNYADAALYRIFSFYFSMGLYEKAHYYLEKLKKEYPDSPYIKYADRNIPQQDLDLIAFTPKGMKEEKVNESVPMKHRTTVPEKKETKETKKVSREYFTIQAGAFLNYKNALALKNKFEAKDWETGIFTKEIGGSIFNVVTVGRFSSRNDAEKFLVDLKKKFGISGRIVRKK